MPEITDEMVDRAVQAGPFADLSQEERATPFRRQQAYEVLVAAFAAPPDCRWPACADDEACAYATEEGCGGETDA